MMNIEKKIEELMNQFRAECEEIAVECQEEGYPSYGSNYELRCESLWQSFYKDDYDDLVALEGN